MQKGKFVEYSRYFIYTLVTNKANKKGYTPMTGGRDDTRMSMISKSQNISPIIINIKNKTASEEEKRVISENNKRGHIFCAGWL